MLIAARAASGDGGLLEGGVGRDLDGAAADIRASSDGELGPSTIRCAST